ncbi:KIR-like CYIR protein, partial [Plasmodium cynomolgi strain B]
MFYNNFNNGGGQCADGSIEEFMNNPGKQHISEENSHKIKGAWCQQITGGKDSTYYDMHCHFLYFWIGDLLSSSVNNDVAFQILMELICQMLRNVYVKNGCNIKCSAIDKNELKNRKMVYDYSCDYNIIRGQLFISEPRCDQNYSEYLKGIFSAYDTIEKACKSPPDAEYCTEFEKMFEGKSHAELLEMKCKTVSTSQPSLVANDKSLDSGKERREVEQLQAETEPSKETGSSTPTARIASTASALVAIPVITLLLYKYNLLPSWFHNQFKGRKKRSMEGIFNDLTEGEYSTEYST